MTNTTCNVATCVCPECMDDLNKLETGCRWKTPALCTPEIHPDCVGIDEYCNLCKAWKTYKLEAIR